MQRYLEFLLRPILEATRPERVVEIGGSSPLDDGLLGAIRASGTIVHRIAPTAIDPSSPSHNGAAPDSAQTDPAIVITRGDLVTGEGLQEAPTGPVAWLSSTPNWSNVTHALRWLDSRRDESRRFPLTLIPHAGWPYGRRDCYAAGDSIPAEDRLPSKRNGLIPGDPEPQIEGGLFQNCDNAIYEGTLRNGVLTAVEDFMADRDGSFETIVLPGAHGFVILVPDWFPRVHPDAMERLERMRPTPEVTAWTEQLESDRIDAEIRAESARSAARSEQESREKLIRELSEQLETSHQARERDQRRLAELEETTHDDRQTIARQRTRAARLRAALQLLYQRLETERSESKQRISDLLREAAKMHREHEAIRQELDELRDRLAHERNERHRIEEKLRRAAPAQSETDAQAAERQALRSKLEAARRRVRQLEARDPEVPRNSSSGSVEEGITARHARLVEQYRALRGHFDDLRAATRQVLQSKRWRIGHAIGELQRRLFRKKRGDLPHDRVHDVLSQFDDWSRRAADVPGPQEPVADAGDSQSESVEGERLTRAMARVAVRPHELPPVSILVYSAGDLSSLRDTLASLRRCTDTEKHSVTVIDDSAQPNQPERIRSLARGIMNLRVASHPTRLGRLAAVVSVLRTVSDNDLCLVHEGVTVTPGWLDGLQGCAGRVGNAGAVSPLTPSTSYSVVPMQPGDTIATTARKIQLLSDQQAPTTAIPDLDVILLRRRLLECVPPPGIEGDFRVEMARWLLAAHERGLRCVLADDTYVFVPNHLATEAAQSNTVEHFSAEETAIFEEVERGADCPEIDVLARYQDTEMTLVNPHTAVFLIDSDTNRVPAPLVRLMNDLVLRGIEVRALEFDELQWPDTVEPLFRSRFAGDDNATQFPDTAHVFATSRMTARLVAEWRTSRPKLQGYDLLIDLESIPSHDEFDAEAIDSLQLGLHMLTTTEWSRKEVRFLAGSDGVSVRKIPFGIAIEEFFPLTTRAASDQFRILARLSGRSSDQTVLAACERIHAQDPRVSICLHGTRVDPATVGFPCESLGRLDARQRRAQLHKADVAIDLRSTRHLAVAGLEAMACGVPVVMTNCGGTAEFLRHDHNGWLVEPGNAEDLVDALILLRGESDRRDRLREQGFQTIKNYGRDRIAGEIEYLIGTHEVRRTARVRRMSEDITTNIIIPIYNELEYVRLCLESIVKHTTYPYRVYLIDDGSDSHTKDYLRRFADEHEAFHLIENEENLGFVQSCNRGMAATPSGDILLLNSDTIVTPDWLRKIVRCAYSDDSIGIVSPLSTRSSHLWIKINPGDSIFQTAERIEEISEANYPDIVTPEGWCFFIRRNCYEHLGEFDSVFGKGYCEESDYSMRALANGYRTVCADDTFVFHKGRVTFKGERGPRYKHNRKIFDRRWKAYYQKLYRVFLDDAPLDYLRHRYAAGRPSRWLTRDEALPLRKKTLRQKLSSHKGVLTILDDRKLEPALEHYRKLLAHDGSASDAESVPQSVTFVLSTFEKYGGVISVTQLANDLVLHGIDTKIVVLNPKRYADDMFVLTEPIFFADTDSMAEHFPRDCNVVATLWVTLYYVARILQRHPNLVPYYFIQDYEPLFYDESQADLRERVIETYRLPARRFAKTHWIIDQVAQHDAPVHKVPPGLDLDVFYPRDVEPSDKIIVLVMMRPKTKRRGFDMIQRVFPELLRRHDSVEVHAFGTDEEDLAGFDIPFPYVNHGHMSARDLPALYSRASIYADLSSFQGFGRTGLEAMACGTACLLTDSGGVSEYAVDGDNCLLVDPQDENAILEGLSRLVLDTELRNKIAAAGLQSVRPFEKTRSSLETWEYLSSGQYRVPSPSGETRDRNEQAPVA